jgi:hypothetical protein
MLTKAENMHLAPSQSLDENAFEVHSQLEFFEQDGGVEEIDEGDGEIKRPYDPAKTHIITRQQSIDSLARRIQFGEIDMAPDFQRGAGLWSNERMSRLVESILIRIPLPAFYFEGSDDEKWLVVDGLQRLITFQRFLVDKSLRLSKLEYLQEYEGYAFDALPRDLRRRIEETQVTLHIIQAGTPPEVKFNIFRRINTGGLVLNGQEIRHALNQGPATRFLEVLAKLPAFIEATARSVSSKRMLDREMVLRFLAFTLTPYSQYDEDNLETFLNRHMAILNQLTAGRLDELEERFERAMHAARDIFGPAAFRKQDRRQANRRNPINKPLFEAWSAVLGGCSPADLQRLVDRREQLARRMEDACMNDHDFFLAISQATNNVISVHRRFSTIETMVAATLAGESAP